MPPATKTLTKHQVERRLIGSGLVGIVIAGTTVTLLMLIASDDPFGILLFTFLAAVAGFAFGFGVARIVWRADMKRHGISGFGSPSDHFYDDFLR